MVGICPFYGFSRMLSALITVSMVASYVLLLARWPIGTHRARPLSGPVG